MYICTQTHPKRHAQIVYTCRSMYIKNIVLTVTVMYNCMPTNLSCPSVNEILAIFCYILLNQAQTHPDHLKALDEL